MQLDQWASHVRGCNEGGREAGKDDGDQMEGWEGRRNGWIGTGNAGVGLFVWWLRPLPIACLLLSFVF